MEPIHKGAQGLPGRSGGVCDPLAGSRRERRSLGRAGPWSGLLASPFSDWCAIRAADPGSEPNEDWRMAVGLGGLCGNPQGCPSGCPQSRP